MTLNRAQSAVMYSIVVCASVYMPYASVYSMQYLMSHMLVADKRVSLLHPMFLVSQCTTLPLILNNSRESLAC
jgi:hypothetical protein